MKFGFQERFSSLFSLNHRNGVTTNSKLYSVQDSTSLDYDNFHFITSQEINLHMCK